MQKEMEAGSWRGKAKEDGQTARVVPNVLAQYKEDTMRTTGRHEGMCKELKDWQIQNCCRSYRSKNGVMLQLYCCQHCKGFW